MDAVINTAIKSYINFVVNTSYENICASASSEGCISWNYCASASASNIELNNIASANITIMNGVVNTITGGRIPLRDGFEIRRAAAEKRVPCFTSLDTVRAAVETLLTGNQIYSAQPLSDYRTKELV